MKNLQITAYMQHFIRQQVMLGDICIDATMGNGNDTALLSQLAGKRHSEAGTGTYEGATEKR